MKIKLLFLSFLISAYSFSQVSSGQSNSFEDPTDEFTITPNPAKSQLNIKLPNADEDLKIEVFDVLGKRVYKGLITQLESSINVTNWKSGVYLVRVSNEKITQTKRFIKQ